MHNSYSLNHHEKNPLTIPSGSYRAYRYRYPLPDDSVSIDRRKGTELRPVQHLFRPVHLVWICLIHRFFCCAVQSIQITRLYQPK
jgi:hypothetical protein